MTIVVYEERQKSALRSVKLINRVLYLNGDPALNFILPYQWTFHELIDTIRRACEEYDLVVTYQAAGFLAERLVRQILKEAPPEMGLEGDRLPFLQFTEYGKQAGNEDSQTWRPYAW